MKINKQNIYRLNVLVFLQFLFIVLHSQEIHFSQIHSVPLQISPSNTGVGIENLRFSNNYRNQWYSIDYPYQTLYVAIDKRINIMGRQAGIGAFLIHDQSSDLYLTSEKFYLSISHSFFYGNNQIILGAQPGFVHKKYNNNNITYNSQFDPGSQTFDPSLPNHENYINDWMNYFDLNLGFQWRTRINNSFTSSGITLSHINRPNESFSNTNDSLSLPVQYTFFGMTSLRLSSKIQLSPQVLYSSMHSAREFIGGAITSYSPDMQDFIVKKVYILTSFRVNPFQNVDALILGAGAKIADLDICLSYDFNVSSLNKASNFKGAFEISIIYLVNKPLHTKIDEPCFML
jgi:type IX secretion system PorP/SprF family membrane protein